MASNSSRPLQRAPAPLELPSSPHIYCRNALLTGLMVSLSSPWRDALLQGKSCPQHLAASGLLSEQHSGGMNLRTQRTALTKCHPHCQTRSAP